MRLRLKLMDSNKDFEMAVAHINTVIDTYPGSDAVDQAIFKKPEALLGWGKSLNDSESYLKSA